MTNWDLSTGQAVCVGTVCVEGLVRFGNAVRRSLMHGGGPANNWLIDYWFRSLIKSLKHTSILHMCQFIR